MRKQLIIITFMAIITICCLVYTIIDQQKQIVKLEQQLQYEQLKYKMLYRDPIVREVIESGG
ncbi:hypothetical protein [Enterococcus sp. AZ034]|uniref:hypothetical protein n=1 Tax=Enterococcus sp. AZ034 TaxID=2774833 RepID=UPI003F26B486